MTREFSVYLDLVRFLAACLVLVYHSNARNIVEQRVPLSDYGHTAVIVFFVLSGYVIAYISDTKERTFKDYWASRLARIYSLAIPAVLLTPLLDVLGESLNASFYAGNTTHDYWLLRILSSLTFMNEVWFVSIMCFSNVPYWSVNYEMWYYIFFSAYAFSTGRRRILLLVLGCVLIGPKIVLLAPAWVLGVVLYRYRPAYRIPEWGGWLAVVSSVLLFVWFDTSRVTDMVSGHLRGILGDHWYRQLTFSRWFLTDYVLAGIVFLNFVGVRRVIFRVSPLVQLVQRPIRWLAGYTFSIYMFHVPLLYFFAAALSMNPAGYGFYAAVMTCTIAAIFLLGTLTEQKRSHLKAWISSWLDGLERTRIWRERVLPIFAK